MAINGIYRVVAQGVQRAVGTYRQDFETTTEWTTHIENALNSPNHVLGFDTTTAVFTPIQEGIQEFHFLPFDIESDSPELVIDVEDLGTSLYQYKVDVFVLVETQSEV